MQSMQTAALNALSIRTNTQSSECPFVKHLIDEVKRLEQILYAALPALRHAYKQDVYLLARDGTDERFQLWSFLGRRAELCVVRIDICHD